MCLAAENLRGGRYYIGAVKIAERMVIIAVMLRCCNKLHSILFSNRNVHVLHEPYPLAL